MTETLPTVAATLPHGADTLDRQDVGKSLRLVFIGRRTPEIVSDRADGLPNFLRRSAGSNVDVHGVISRFGKATAVIFAREGAKVLAADINLDAALETKRIIDGEGEHHSGRRFSRSSARPLLAWTG